LVMESEIIFFLVMLGNLILHILTGRF